MSFLSVIPLINILLCMGLGMFVLSHAPKQMTNVIFAFSMAGLGLWEMGHFQFLNTGEENSAFFWSKFSMVAGMVVTPSWLFFSLMFARTRPIQGMVKWKYPLSFIFVVFGIYILLAVSTDFIGIMEISKTDRFGVMLGFSSYTYYIFHILVLVLILINFENTFRSSFGSKRWQIKYFLLAFSGLIAFWIFMISQFLLFSFVDSRLFIVKSSILVFILSFMAFTLFSRKVLNVNVLVSRPVVYNSLTLLLVGGYLLLVGITAQGLYSKSDEWGFYYETFFIFFAILALSVLLLSENLRIKAKALINRHVFSGQYDYRLKWLDLTEALSRKFSIDEMAQPLLEFLVKTISVKNATLWLCDGHPREFKAVRSMNTRLEKGKSSPIEVDSQFIKYFNEKEKPWTFSDSGRIDPAVDRSIQPLFPEGSPGVVLPLIASKQWVGLITLGPKLSEENFNFEDIEFLNVIGKQAASVLLNSRLSLALIKAKENEAFHQAALFFIHDLKNFVTMLSLVVQNSERYIGNPQFQKDAFKNISDTVQKMHQLIQRLTHFSKGFHPNVEEGNLNDVVGRVINRLKGSIKTPIDFNPLDLPVSQFDFNQMETVVTNLILNAEEASDGKGEISVKTFYGDARIHLEITDQGVGFNENFKNKNLFKPFQTTKSGGMGFGLFQSHQILLAHQGEMAVESEEGKGCRIAVSIPLTVSGGQSGKN